MKTLPAPRVPGGRDDPTDGDRWSALASTERVGYENCYRNRGRDRRPFLHLDRPDPRRIAPLVTFGSEMAETPPSAVPPGRSRGDRPWSGRASWRPDPRLDRPRMGSRKDV